ncbi:hypothetical protein vBBak6_079 [Bacillus phage v_B-Bak6]|nr:hypothetical protein vBBak1_079 [Bacillus phage v_B-Bak1]AXY83159.1 hypothetical protein vBBak6_079 [Bacillus phage v_B-Bak6]
MTNYKPNFKYINMGIVTGQLVYVQDRTKKDTGEVYGKELLVFAKGFGSINVRVPLDIGNRALDNYSVSDKPAIRVNLAKLEQFTAEQSGVTYTNVTTFVDIEDCVDNNGQPMAHKFAGRIGGEIINFQNLGNVLKFAVVSYNLDKDKKLAINKNTGQPYDPAVIKVEVHNPQIIQSALAAGLGEGANAEIGYYYYNKQDITYDDFGMPVGDPNNKIDRVEAGRINVQAPSPNAGQQQQGFGGQPQGQQFGNQQQQGGFPNVNGQMPTGMGQQQQQGNPFGQQPNQQQGQNPFGQQQQQQQPVNQGQQQMQQNPFTGQQQQVQQQQGNPFAGQPNFNDVDTSQAAPFEQGFNQTGQPQGQFGQQAQQFFGGQQGGNPFQQ